MVLSVGASCLDNAYRSLSYTTRKRLKEDIIAIRGLSLNPKSINPLKILQNLLEKGFLESKKIIIWQDVVSNTISKHGSSRHNPCEIDKLLEILTGLKKNIEAILYCRRLGSPNLFQQLKETGILRLDVKRRLTSTRKRNNPDISADPAAIYPKSSRDNKLICTVLENKNNLGSLAKKRRSKSKKQTLSEKEKKGSKKIRIILKLVIFSPCINWSLRDFGILVGTQFVPGEMGERNKKNKARKCLNCTNLIGTDPSIFCHACEKWTHGYGAKVSKEQIELLEQIEGAMWFCDKCRYVKSSIQTGLTEFKAELDQELTAVKDLVKQTIVKHDETTEI